jgi:hypothetical protein
MDRQSFDPVLIPPLSHSSPFEPLLVLFSGLDGGFVGGGVISGSQIGWWKT